MKRYINSGTSTNEVTSIKEQLAMHYLRTLDENDIHLTGFVDGAIYVLSCLEDKSEYQVFEEIKSLANMRFDL